METLSIATPTHGRALVELSGESQPAGAVVAFHGYGQNAADMLREIDAIPGIARWHRVAVQALHRFYARDHQTVVASWMTREDRDLAIADNVEYVDRAIDAAFGGALPRALVFVGFSQGTAMAYRAALLGRHRADGVIALGGDVPPDLKAAGGRWPPVLVGAGTTDYFFTAVKLQADTDFLASRLVRHRVVTFDGGHEWTDDFRRAASDWLGEIGV